MSSVYGSFSLDPESGANSPTSHPATSAGNFHPAERVSGVNESLYGRAYKPRLDVRFGIWRCCSWAGLHPRVAGFGETPQQAYQEWKAQIAA